MKEIRCFNCLCEEYNVSVMGCIYLLFNRDWEWLFEYIGNKFVRWEWGYSCVFELLVVYLWFVGR